jgi:hypothetical protein
MQDSNWQGFLDFTKKVIENSKAQPEEKAIPEKKIRKRKEENIPVLEKEFNARKLEESANSDSFYIVGEKKLNDILAVLDKVNARLTTISREHESMKKSISEMEEKLRLKEQMDDLKGRMIVLKKGVARKKRK